MKIKKIAAICNQEGVFRLYNHTDNDGVVTQWLGSNSAIYQLPGLPMLDEDSLCAMFDIPKKKREKLSILCVKMPEIINTEDITREYLLDATKLSICYQGTTLLPLRTEKGTIFIQEKLLEPLGDENDFLELYCRETPQGFPYVAVKEGMLLRAIILPFEIFEINVDIAQQLESIAQGHRKMRAWRKTMPGDPFAGGEKGREEEGRD